MKHFQYQDRQNLLDAFCKILENLMEFNKVVFDV